MSANHASPSAIPEREDKADPNVTDNPAWHGSTQEAQTHRGAASVHLTRRELEVLSLLCEGLPNKLIGRRLHISLGTVKVHIGNILRELGVSSRLHAVVVARRWGIVDECTVTIARKRIFPRRLHHR